LTPDMIRAWRDAGFPSWAMVEKKPENHALYTASQQVNHAIARFVNETVVNPTAADTPPWARNPWGAFLFQLKGFTMTANKRMLMGAYRELRHQYEAGGISQSTASAAAWVLPGIAILLLLAAMQEELRQRLRSMGENGIVGNYHNDPVKIAQVLGDRAGITNLPFLGAVVNPTTSNIAFELGPTVSKAVQLAGDAQKGDAAGAIALAYTGPESGRDAAGGTIQGEADGVYVNVVVGPVDAGSVNFHPHLASAARKQHIQVFKQPACR